MRYRLRPGRAPTLKILASAVFLAALASGIGVSEAQTAPPAAAASAIKTLDRAQIDALRAQSTKVLFIDVRRADEISSLGGFPIFLSVQNGDLERLVSYIPRDRIIVTVSNHAHRAVRAGEILASKGYRVAGAAGVLDYEAQGGVLVGKKSAVPAVPVPATAKERPGQ